MKWLEKLKKKIEEGNERGARKALLEELFNDFNKSRVEVYRMNLVRGIFFGLGSTLGATVVVGLIIWLLNIFTDLPGGIGNFIQDVLSSMQQKT